MNPQPLLYCISKYGGRESESIEENNHAVAQLFEKGYLPFSPIVNSHHFDLWLKSRKYCKSFQDECRSKDCDGLPNNSELDGNTICYGIHGLSNKLQYKIPNYYEYDLAIMERFLRHDTNNDINHVCRVCGDTICGSCQKGRIDYKYDSGLIAVLLDSALPTINWITASYKFFEHQDWEPILKKNGLSIGVAKEYQFCHDHHVLCITLETALTIPPESWKEYGL